MARPILLDTDVLVDFFRGNGKAVAFIDKYHTHIILSSIVVAELYAGVKGDAEQAALEDFVSLFRVVPVSAEIGKAGGLYKRDYGKPSSRCLPVSSDRWRFTNNPAIPPLFAPSQAIETGIMTIPPIRLVRRIPTSLSSVLPTG